jgi:hypothetical protein
MTIEKMIKIFNEKIIASRVAKRIVKREMVYFILHSVDVLKNRK